jgi:hypothetical protein
VIKLNAGVEKSRERRSANTNSTRSDDNEVSSRRKNALGGEVGAVLQSVKPVKRQSEYQGYRPGPTDQSGSSHTMPIIIGAAMIAAAILLSTLVSALGQRYVGLETPNEESAWLVDRLTGSVYKCLAPERGRASCDAEATGSIVGRGKR